MFPLFLFLWDVYILVLLILNVGLWVTSPPGGTWPQQLALSGRYLILCALFFMLCLFLESVPYSAL
jgi:hypothetical protein